MVGHNALRKTLWLHVEAAFSFTSIHHALSLHGRTFPSAPWLLCWLTHIPQALSAAMAIHPLLLMDNWLTAAAEVVGSLGFHAIFSMHIQPRFRWCLLGVDTRWTIDLLAPRYRRWIRPSTAVDGWTWDWRELVEMGRRGRNASGDGWRRWCNGAGELTTLGIPVTAPYLRRNQYKSNHKKHRQEQEQISLRISQLEKRVFQVVSSLNSVGRGSWDLDMIEPLCTIEVKRSTQSLHKAFSLGRSPIEEVRTFIFYCEKTTSVFLEALEQSLSVVTFLVTLSFVTLLLIREESLTLKRHDNPISPSSWAVWSSKNCQEAKQSTRDAATMDCWREIKPRSN
jgi:hypothetical protein